jgi:hypothetical protein
VISIYKNLRLMRNLISCSICVMVNSKINIFAVQIFIFLVDFFFDLIPKRITDFIGYYSKRSIRTLGYLLFLSDFTCDCCLMSFHGIFYLFIGVFVSLTNGSVLKCNISLNKWRLNFHRRII